MSKTSFVLLTLLLSGLGLGLYAWQASEAIEQHRIISTYLFVEATVNQARVDQHVSRDSKGRTSVSYSPFVEYEYEVGGRRYTNIQVLPMPHTGSSAWANGIASRFSSGETCVAYYDPAQPDASFLVKEYRFLYYGLALLGLALGCIPFLIWAGTPRTNAVLAPPAADGWREVRIARTVEHRIAASFLASAVVNGGWVVTLGHCVWAAGVDDAAWLIASASACTIVGLIPVWYLVRTYLLGRCIGEARLLLPSAPVRVGQAFQVRVEQALKVDVNVEEVVLELVCDRTAKTTSSGKTRISTSEAHRARVQALPARLFGPGESLTATCELRVPEHLDATWQKGEGYPHHAWRVEVDTKLSGAPDYRGRFPILVERA